MDETARSFLVGTLGVWTLLLVAAGVALPRRPHRPVRARLWTAGWLAIAAQAGHFAEELGTGFHERFPALLGLAPWPAWLFAAFNLSWLVLWAAALAGADQVPRTAGVLIWFLALACIANFIAHPAMAAIAGGYFPGLVTSPLVGLAGLFLALRLGRTARA